MFMSGDYELLCKMYGISGASGNTEGMHFHTRDILMVTPLGRHCCLWCHITQKQLKEAPSTLKEQPKQRDLDTLATAHFKFTSEGKSDLNVAKQYFNAIAEPFFNIPLDQVIKTGCGITGR